eukprot:COSAG02_NODE_5732_length_4083_cov_2.870733_2_plen_113_part_00
MAKFRAALANMSEFTASRFSRVRVAVLSASTGAAVVFMLYCSMRDGPRPAFAGTSTLLQSTCSFARGTAATGEVTLPAAVTVSMPRAAALRRRTDPAGRPSNDPVFKCMYPG